MWRPQSHAEVGPPSESSHTASSNTAADLDIVDYHNHADALHNGHLSGHLNGPNNSYQYHPRP